MSCSSCVSSCDQCQHSEHGNVREIWQPSTTVQRACELVQMLFEAQGCDVRNCPDREICRLLELECELCGGKYPLAALAMLVAARLMEREAAAFARKGNVKTLTISFNGNQTASELREIAQSWRESAKSCVPVTKFAYAKLGRACKTGTAQSAYDACGCFERLTKFDTTVYRVCDFDCCDDCDD